MKTSTLFVVGLIVGAFAVFGIRAASLGAAKTLAPQPTKSDASLTTTPVEPPQGTSDPAAVANKPGVIRVVLDANGEIASASMEMVDGGSHAIAPGAHAPMGNYVARVEGREGTYQAHLHAHSEHRLELTVMTGEGGLVAKHIFEHTPDSAAANGTLSSTSDATQPENEICPVMGNEVDPTMFVDYKGRRIAFCCPGCDELFLKDPEKYLKKVDAEIAARKGAK